MRDYTNTNEFLRDYMTVEARAKELELQGPIDSGPSTVVKYIVLGILVMIGLIAWMSLEP